MLGYSVVAALSINSLEQTQTEFAVLHFVNALLSKESFFPLLFFPDYLETETIV